MAAVPLYKNTFIMKFKRLSRLVTISSCAGILVMSACSKKSDPVVNNGGGGGGTGVLLGGVCLPENRGLGLPASAER